MGLNGCCWIIKYLVVLVNFLFLVSAISHDKDVWRYQEILKLRINAIVIKKHKMEENEMKRVAGNRGIG